MTVKFLLFMSVFFQSSVIASIDQLSKGNATTADTFNFLIGNYLCDDVLTSPDGRVTKLKGHWKGGTILNGNAIQDHYWNDQYAATNIRIFDPSQKKWLVTYFRYPPYRTGTWKGGINGDKIVLKRAFQYHGQNLTSELVFENISQQGFYWHSSYISKNSTLINWTSKCLRTSASL